MDINLIISIINLEVMGGGEEVVDMAVVVLEEEEVWLSFHGQEARKMLGRNYLFHPP
jgi:hypothetical protein